MERILIRYSIILLLGLFTITALSAQTKAIKGMVVDSQNDRKLNNVEISIIDSLGGTPVLIKTNDFGMYTVDLEVGKEYTFELVRVAYRDLKVQVIVMKDDEVASPKFSMQRLPGYEFQVDVKELLSGGGGTANRMGKKLQNLKIEIYNNTLGKEIRVTEDNPENTFEANFERGNHYTLLIRKKGYYAKRVEVNVDIFGCILCFEGLGNNFAPEIEAATEDNEKGLLIADIPMKKIVKDEVIRLDNIYYDYDKYLIRADAKPALDELVRILKRNPIKIELGSHTDSRGTAEYNLNLSEKRAKSAVEYIISRGVMSTRVSSKGYGESNLLNECSDDVKCTEKEHQFNRRTEFKVVGFLDATNFDKKTLKQILEEEKLTKKRIKEKIEGI